MKILLNILVNVIDDHRVGGTQCTHLYGGYRTDEIKAIGRFYYVNYHTRQVITTSHTHTRFVV